MSEPLYDDLKRFLHDRPRPPRVIALGEPLHGVDAFLRLRNDLFRRIIADEGSRWVALESGCLAGRTVDDHVRTGRGALDQVMAEGVTHGFDAMPGNRALVEWMGGHNAARPPEDQVRFAGFDAPTEITGAESPRAALRMLHTFLAERSAPPPPPWSRIEALLGDDAQWTNPAVMYDAAEAVGASPAARELRARTADLEWLLTCQAPRFAAEAAGSADAADAVRDAELAARAAVGLLAYHAAMAEPDQGARLVRMVGVRDAMMAANLQALAADPHGRGPVLVSAQNQHVRRGTAWIDMGGIDLYWSPSGAHTARTYGAGYAVIALAVGAAPYLDIGDPPADTLEGALAATTTAPRLVPGGELARIAATPGIRTRPTTRLGYIPLAPAALADVDAVLFLPHLDPPAA